MLWFLARHMAVWLSSRIVVSRMLSFNSKLVTCTFCMVYQTLTRSFIIWKIDPDRLANRNLSRATIVLSAQGTHNIPSPSLSTMTIQRKSLAHLGSIIMFTMHGALRSSATGRPLRHSPTLSQRKMGVANGLRACAHVT